MIIGILLSIINMLAMLYKMLVLSLVWLHHTKNYAKQSQNVYLYLSMHRWMCSIMCGRLKALSADPIVLFLALLLTI